MNHWLMALDIFLAIILLWKLFQIFTDKKDDQ